MNQLHNGQRSCTPSGNPWRMLFRKQANLPPALVSSLSSFEQNLELGLRKLRTPPEKIHLYSLSWMRRAVEYMIEIHTSIAAFITDLQFPVSDWDERWVDIYLDYSTKLLDTCNALNSEISRINRGQLLLKHALHNFDSSNGTIPSSGLVRQAHSSLENWGTRIESQGVKLEICSSLLQHLSRDFEPAKANKDAPEAKALMRALYGVKVSTTFLFSVILSALSGCPCVLLNLHVPDKYFWSEAFNALQAHVIAELASLPAGDGSKTLLVEIETAKKSIEKLQVLMHPEQETDGRCLSEQEGLKDAVAQLADNTKNLGDALDFISGKMDEFFKVVFSSRKALLGGLRAGCAEPGKTGGKHL